MIFDPATAPQLKPWLVRTLEPICDAEPGALADYILALLKHNVPESEMRKEIQVQLDEFLENECAGFVDTLFTVLRTKSYLPYAPAPASPKLGQKPHDVGIPIPLDGLISPSIPPSDTRPRKRSIESDDRDLRPPAKGPRLNSDNQFSRYSSGNDSRQEGRWNDRGDGPRDGYSDGTSEAYRSVNGGMGYTNGRPQQSYQPPGQRRGVCRDYHNYGYCARGALCKYSHGDDAVVPPFFPAMAPGMPFLPLFPNGAFAPTVAYDPHEARMDMRPRQPHQRAPLLPRVQQDDGSRVLHPVNVTGELPVIQDLTPTLPPDSQNEQQQHTGSEPQTRPQTQAPASTPQMMSDGFNQNGFGMAMAMNGFPAMGMNMDVDVTTASMDNSVPNRGGTPYRGHRPQRGRGTFSGEVHNFRPERHTGTTLVVEKIPHEKLSLEQVNDWFKRFGTVTNVAIDSANAKALVSFSKHEEAHAAWKSEDAVFNNRFVKVFWHRPMGGHGQVGARLLAASAPIVASMQTNSISATITPPPPPAAPAAPATTLARKTMTSTTASASTAVALAARQKLLEEQIAEQKSLMAQLETTSGEQKKEILARLRKLGEEMKKPVETTVTTTTAPSSNIVATSSSPSTPAPNAVKRATSTPAEDRERMIREKLDRELEMHNATVVAESATRSEGGESMEDLKSKLESLKAEAASLGISDVGSDAGGGRGSGYRGWYRGRARGGRSYYRGSSATRGGPPRSMKLDNRPKKLLVKGAKEEHVQAVKEWYNTTSQVESVEMTDDGDVVVSFRSRAAAEQGLAKGTGISNVGPVQLSWYAGTASTPSGPGASSSTRASAQPEAEPTSGSGEHDKSQQPVSTSHEEEIVASGWGDDDGDGMGFGMI